MRLAFDSWGDRGILPMSSRVRIAFILIALPFGATSAAAQATVPKLDLTRTCRPLDRNDFSIQIDSKRCLQTENEARAKLAKEWPTYPARDRRLCTARARIAGFESYVQLLTCLELQNLVVAPTQRDPAVAANPQTRSRSVTQEIRPDRAARR